MRGQRGLAVLVVIGAFLVSAGVTFATCSDAEGDRGAGPTMNSSQR